MSGENVVSAHATECKNAVSAFKRELLNVRTGRASSGLVENIQVDYYGSKTALQHLAQISTPEARLILVQVYDASAVSAIEKAIQTSGLGFNPSRDGNSLRIVVPPLTQETRKDIVKHLHKLAEDMRISIRNHRRDANEAVKKLEKDGEVTKDDVKKLQDRVQKQTDAAIQEVDKLLQGKEAEIMEV